MLEYSVEPNGDIFIRIQLMQSDTGLYPQAKIYAISDPSTVVDTVNLDEVVNGLYGKKWTNNGVKTKYFVQIIVYTNSGHTNKHALIEPDSDSINVGFNTSGFSFGGKSKGTTVLKHKLTKEEIEKIALAIYKLMKPDITKISTFDPKKDIVKTNITIPPAKEITIDPFPTVLDIAKAVKTGLNIDDKLKAFKQAPTIEQISKLVKKYPSFEAIKQLIEDNRGKTELSKEHLGALESLDSKLIEMSKKKDIPLIDEIIKLIKLNGDSFKIYELFKELDIKERDLIFNFLFKYNPTLLKELGLWSDADKIVEKLKKAKNKNTVFNDLISTGRIKNNLIPFIKKLYAI